MIFTESTLAGAYTIEMTRVEDERGFFARSYSTEEFAARGLPAEMPQCSISFNLRKGTLRGMHFQAAPHSEDKLVRCTAGAIFDVIVDLRADSPTLRRWFATDLTAENRRSLFIPKGFAHGFVTLRDDTEVLYMMSVPYAPGHERGVRWNDPALAIHWPIEPAVISARDAAYPLLDASTVA
ncbi:MAG: dTDP-4-dehydrorhamnose 3,5-epimerase [Steroidobacteraceae bacterium]